MLRHLPTIGSLRSFEATARHLSFTRAAIELNVTQTAISHRIKELEEMLGVQLFTRDRNRVQLTHEGRTYLDLIRPALSDISLATERVAQLTRKPRLRVLCLTTFLIKRLIPNLADFQRAHPDVEIQLTPMNNRETLSRSDFDVAIWYGSIDSRDWPGFEVERLGSTLIFPVCSPKLLEAAPLAAPKDICKHTIIRSFSPLIMDDWPAWLNRAGLGDLEFASELQCAGSFLSIEAAINGLGIFIGRTEMVASALADGLLIEPFDIRLESTSSYYLLIQNEKAARAEVDAFRTWLLGTLSNPQLESRPWS